jgi:alpha-tubulin suppressor-like RCC1 family protein
MASDSQCGSACVSCPAPAQCRAGSCEEDCTPGLIRVDGVCREGRDVQLGLLHGCARHDGGVVCWGTGVSTGALGAGLDAGQSPQRVVGLSDVVSLAVGDNFGCGLLGTGAVRCWGSNMFGQIGNGGSNNAFTPQVALGRSVVSLAAGARHACALLTDAGVVCWGSNMSGQHGTGSTAFTVRSPQPMTIDAGVTALFAGGDGTWTLSGEQPPRLSGDSSFFGLNLSPTPIAEFDAGVRFIATGDSHGCAILPNRTLHCWGDGFKGQLGYPVGSMTDQPVRPVPGLGQVFDVCVGQDFTCALIADGGVRCFGGGAQGQLGGGNVNSSTSPVEVVSLPPATQVGCHFFTACATTAVGVFCWGDNTYGQLGVATPMSSAFPIAVPLP